MSQKERFSLCEWLVIATISVFAIWIMVDDVRGIRRDKGAEFLPKTGNILVIARNTSAPQETAAELVPDAYKIGRVTSITDLNYVELVSSDQTKRIVLSYEEFSYALKHTEFTVVAPDTPTSFPPQHRSNNNNISNHQARHDRAFSFQNNLPFSNGCYNA